MNHTISGRLYDGSSSSSIETRLIIDTEGTVSIDNQTSTIGTAQQIQASPRIGNSARHLTLPDGRKFETRDNDAIDLMCSQWQPSDQALPHKLESNLKLVWTSLFGLIAIGYVFVIFGLPLMSKQVTAWLPTSLDDQLAAQALPQMDRVVFNPSTLPPERQKILAERFDQLLPETERDYFLYFRDGGAMGANAFALPDGTIVVTDQLVALAEDDDMIAAVLLHEIGHVEHRHSMQNIVRQAGLSIFVVAITGDVGTVSSLILLLPNLLIQAEYSREFEWEADSYALDQMNNLGIDPKHFADMMEQLSLGIDPKNHDTDNDSWSDYFSSHPASEKRAERFRAASP